MTSTQVWLQEPAADIASMECQSLCVTLTDVRPSRAAVVFDKNTTGVIHPGSSQRHHLPQSNNPRSLKSRGQILTCPAGKSLYKLEAESRAPAGQMDQALPPLLFSPKKKRDGASICVMLMNLDLTRAPCAETPSRLAMADFFDLRESKSP
ncbi:unnamed protein product [Merluccius merluccius]